MEVDVGTGEALEEMDCVAVREALVVGGGVDEEEGVVLDVGELVGVDDGVMRDAKLMPW